MGVTPWWFGLGPQLGKPPCSKVHLEWHVIFPHVKDVNVLVHVYLG